MRLLAKIAFVVLALMAGLQPVLAATTCQSMIVPSYLVPTASSQLFGLFYDDRARSRIPYVVVASCAPKTAPCVKRTDPIHTAFADVVRIGRKAGVQTLGYVWTANGTRSVTEIKVEIDLYNIRYGVDGILLDGVHAGTDIAIYNRYVEIADHVRASRGFLVLNPGTYPALSYYARIADMIVGFDGTYNDYVNAWKAPPDWVQYYPASKFVHLVHTTPNTATAMRNALLLSHGRNAATVLVTDDVLPNPWDRLPSFLTREVNDMYLYCD